MNVSFPTNNNVREGWWGAGELVLCSYRQSRGL